MNITHQLSTGILCFIKEAVWTLPMQQKMKLLKILHNQSRAARIRKDRIQDGAISSPAYLIYSVTNRCNLNCVGCYAKAKEQRESCVMSTEEARCLLGDAANMGIGTVIVVGGEPLMRQDIFDLMAERRDLVFLLFTNGTLLSDAHIQRLKKLPHVVPVISMEGKEVKTDDRRGEGVGQLVDRSMERLKKAKLLYGISLTVDKDNLEHTLAQDFTIKMKDKGCSIIFYIEYVPVAAGTKDKVLDETDREELINKVSAIRNRDGILAVTFPGDEKELGGCLAAGRGFVHVSGNGSVEPCPFSPYSTHNVKDGLEKVVDSPFFQALREHEHLMEEPEGGGCALFARKEEIEALVKTYKEKAN